MWIVPKNYRPLSASALAWVDSKEVLKSEEDLNINSSLAWRGKLMPVDSWCRKWNQVSYLPALFGRTLRHSHRIYFETALTSSLEGIHANRSQLRTQRQKDQKTSDIYSMTSSDTSKQYVLPFYSLKMSRDTSIEDYNKTSVSWKKQVITQRGEYSQRLKSAYQRVTHKDYIKGKGSSFFPTPTATPYGTSQNGQRADGSKYKQAGKLSLESMARHNRWPTPTVSDYKGSGPTYIRKDGKDRRRDRLDYAVEQKSGTLNPQFVEWLMGLPIGWTELDC